MQSDNTKKRLPIPAGFFAAFLFFIVIPIAIGESVPSKQSPSQQLLNAQSTPQTILTTCVSYAQGLVPEERAFLLVRIATVASANYFTESSEWARQAFVTSSDLPASWDKVALQKSALIALSSTEPADALRLLGTLPVPPHPASNQGTRLDEDTRADAARVIFEAAYREGGKKSLAPMLEISSSFGETGEYPFEAWGILLPKIAKEHPSTFDEAISTAVDFYSSGEDRTISQDEDYLDMVNAIHTTASPTQMKMAVSAGIDRLQSEKPAKNETYIGVVGQGTQKTVFDSRSSDLLHQWLPLVQEFDSADYDDLARKLDVTAPPEKNTRHATAEILGDPKNIAPAVQQRVHDRLQAEIIENDAANDPDRAIGESIAIRSMAIRADALAVGAMNISEKEMLQRKKLFAESRHDLDHVQTKDKSYLQAVADLAQGYFHSKMPHQAISLVHDGLNQGSDILDESADAQPNTPTMLLDGYDSLGKLTQIGMHLDPDHTLRIVRSLQNEPLKVNLLVDIADALATKQSA